MEFSILADEIDDVVIDYVGRDVYELTYTWSHDSKEFIESEWKDIHANKKARTPPARIGVVRVVGNAKKYKITWSMRPMREMTEGERADLVRVNAIKDDFVYDGGGVDSFVVGPLPRRLYQ